MSRPLLAFLLLIVVLLLVFAWTATAHYKGHYPQTSWLPMTFAHADHSQQQCIKCHHNYQDQSGQGLCLICHQSKPEISYKVRDQFHSLCMGCHKKNRDSGDKAGPLRRCIACHVEDDQP